MQLLPDWKTALTRHWSAWAYYSIAALALLPEFLGLAQNVPPYLYLALVVVGLGAKIVKQELPAPGGDDADK
jgi:hypothetical protein